MYPLALALASAATTYLATTCHLVRINFFVFHRDKNVIDTFPALPCDGYESQGSAVLRHLLTIDSDKIGFQASAS